MLWATFLLLLISGYAAVKLFGLTQKRGRLKFLGLTIAAGIFLLMQIASLVNILAGNPEVATITGFLIEWGHVTSLAFILSSLAVFIRESKPVFAQFPMLYTALPLLIVISYILVKDTYALKIWLVTIYQGGAILVALLMYSVYTYRRNEYAIILFGVIIFLVNYIIYWYLPGFQDSYTWIWKVMMAAGMGLTIVGYEKTEFKLEKEPALS